MTERIESIFVRLVIVGFTLSYLVTIGGKNGWPFVHWNLYSAGKEVLPRSMSELYLHAQDVQGNTYVIKPYSLLTFDDISSAQPGRKLLSVDDNQYLYNEVERMVQADITQIQLYRYVWSINYEKPMIISNTRPDQMQIKQIIPYPHELPIEI